MSEIKVNSIKGVGASAAAITVNNTDGTCTANVTNNLSNRNAIVNGAMEVAQRGTSSSSANFASVDRIKVTVNATNQLAFLQKQTSDGPDGFSKCFEFDVTTAESALDADDLVYMRYAVEAQDLVPFFNANGTGKDFVLSFYVKAYQAGTYQIGIYKADSTARFITKTYTINASATWQRVVIPITGDTNTDGIVADNGLGFQISFMLGAGSNYTSGSAQTTWGGWPGNPGFAKGQAVNVLSSTDNYWRITGLQLEVDQGSGKATDFEHRSFAQELALCQRYYYVHASGNDQSIGVGVFYQASNMFTFIKLPVNMRSTPSIDQTTGTNYYQAYNSASSDEWTGFASMWNSTNTQVSMNTNSGQGLSLGSDGQSAMVKTSNSAAFLGFSAEL
tara:strand:+ start:106 stop:1275 length:1170 start_codon:yes stop_codon:yes gene_type:complete